jgi:ABC-type bacteriocin/lantibiotic exporter with double-glycine peptidase domain
VSIEKIRGIFLVKLAAMAGYSHKKILDTWHPHTGSIATLLMFYLLFATAQMPVPVLFGVIIDGALQKKDVDSLFTLLGAMLGLMLVGRVMDHVGESRALILRRRYLVELRSRICQAFLNATYQAHCGLTRGDLTSRIVRDIPELHYLTPDGVARVSRDVLIALVYIGVAFYIDWRLALCALILMPVGAGIFFAMKGRLISLSMNNHRQAASLHSSLRERVDGFRDIKLSNSITHHLNILEARINGSAEAWYDAALHGEKLSALLGVIPVFSTVVVLGAGGYRIVNDGLTPGELASFGVALTLGISPISRVVDFIAAAQRESSVFMRVLEVIEWPREHSRGVRSPIRVALSGARRPPLRVAFYRPATSLSPMATGKHLC